MWTYYPLLHLFPEDLELLKLQHSCVVHLVYRQGQHVNRHGEDKNRAAVTCMCTRMCDSQDTSIRLMILWQVLRVRPSNLISFPEDKTRLSRRETSKMICWFTFLLHFYYILAFWQMIHDFVWRWKMQPRCGLFRGMLTYVCWGRRSASAGAPWQKSPGPASMVKITFTFLTIKYYHKETLSDY